MKNDSDLPSNSFSASSSDQAGTVPLEENGELISNRYRLKRLLGRGSFGQVYYAEDLKFVPPRVVAIKIISTKFTSDDLVCDELKSEASALARFTHPNILRVLDYEVSDEISFIVTEFAAGGSLLNKLQPNSHAPAHPLDLDTVIKYLDQLTDALDQAHGQQIVHRDIKPHNILLDGQGRTLLADFGLAAAISTSGSSLIDTTATGTPLYMAPEQWNGQVGKASDIYSLGVVLFQMLTGQTPFKGNTTALAWQHANAPVPAIATFAPWLGQYPQLDKVMQRVLAKEARQRPHTARELYDSFMAALQNKLNNNSIVNQILPLQPQLHPSQQLETQPITPPWLSVEPKSGFGLNNPFTGYTPQNLVHPDAVARPTKPMAIRTLLIVLASCVVVIVFLASSVLALLHPSSTTSVSAANQLNIPTVPNVVDTAFAQNSSSITTTPTVVTGSVGTTLTIANNSANFNLAVTQMQTSDSLNGKKAADGYHYIFLNITYKTGTNEHYGLSKLYSYLYLRDSENFAYSYMPSPEDANRIPMFNKIDEDLTAGQSINGWLTYEVPKTVKGLVFEYVLQPDFLNAPLGIYEVGLDNQPNFARPSAINIPNAITSGNGKIGDTLDGKTYYMTVTKTEITDTLHTDFKPDSGNEFLTVNILLQSKSDKDVNFLYDSFSLVDNQENSYENKTFRDPVFESGLSLPAGYKTQGWLTFEVPQNKKGLILAVTAFQSSTVLRFAIN